MEITYSEGGCFCGAVRYQVKGTPVGTMICHCNTCRRLFAAPTVVWLSVAKDAFTFTRGAPATFSTSPPVKRWFCQTCGTQIAYVHNDEPNYVEVATCSLDNPSSFPPTHRSWLSHDLDWAANSDALPAFQRSRYS